MGNIKIGKKSENGKGSQAPMIYAYNLSYFEVSPGKYFTRPPLPHFQNNQDKMDWRYGQEVESLLCKCEALSHQKRKKEKKTAKPNLVAPYDLEPKWTWSPFSCDL
jgi:hypothetical protein